MQASSSSSLIEPRTPRLQLRQWRASDRDAFAAMGADAEVMRYFPDTLNRTQSDTLADQIEALITEQGWGFWALERLSDQQFIGFTGLHRPRADLPFAPCVEIGWRLARHAWHQGLAYEAAVAALRVGFGTLQLPEIVAFTTRTNQPSQALMQRLGMQRDAAADFAHPALDAAHPLSEHVLYRITAAQFAARAGVQ